jgi:hypothetical protein
MYHYEDVYERLGLPLTARRIASGEIRHPSVALAAPFECYGFPPALIPLWSDGSGPTYTGYWKHWFVQREMTVVFYDLEEGRAHEVARNFEQLAWLEALNLRSHPSFIAEAESFAKTLGIGNLEQLDAIITQTGDLPEGLQELPAFGSASPLSSCLDTVNYTGDFPFDGMALTPERVRRICGLEVSDELREEIAAQDFAPEWFKTGEQEPVFDKLLRREDYAGAWMSLNSSGWDYSEAKSALRRLNEAVADEAFDILVKAWTAEPHEEAGAY